MAGTRGAFGSIARGRGALKKRGRALVLFGLLASGCATAEAPAPMPAAAPLQSMPAAVARPVVDPRRYQGLGRAELVQLLGTPDFRRSDSGAEVWQYRAGACMLDLFLYEEGGGYRVTHAEAHSRLTGRACPAPLAADARL